MSLLPAIKVEFLIQLRRCCGYRAYAVFGRGIPVCGICGHNIPESDQPWEKYYPDVTPRRDI